MKSVIVGTAGHIDHGKTAMVKALTGMDADRLQEEKRRGITIDIGFAHLELPAPNGDTLRLGFVDVPGHERFVRNMLAGIGGIDLVLLVIAADEGIKPQTREHLDICRLLAVGHGITVLTKSDAVDAEMLEVVRLEAEEFLRGSFLDPDRSPIVPVSSLTGAGLEELKSAIVRVASEVAARDSETFPRLPIDRVFTMKGFGTVVTGTLASGTIHKEDELEVFPGGKRVRVRGVEVHGSVADQSAAGQRTALNLAGVTTEELARGMVLASPATFRPTSTLDVELSLLSGSKPLKDGARAHFHAYTMETVAEARLYGAKRMEPGGKQFVRLRLAEPTLLLPGDRFILRQFSPVVTIGGGPVLDATPLRKAPGQDAFLRILSGGDPVAMLRARVRRRQSQGISVSDLIAETGSTPNEIVRHLKQAVDECALLSIGNRFVDGPAFRELGLLIVAAVADFQKRNPLVAGMSREELRDLVKSPAEILSRALDLLVRDNKMALTGDLVHLPGRGVTLKDEEAESKQVIERTFASAGLKVPALSEVLTGLKIDKIRAQKIVTLLLRDKVLIKVSENLVFHHAALADLRHKLVALKGAAPRMDVSRFKDLAGVSRKYAIPLLEYLDRERVTKRVGDERLIL